METCSTVVGGNSGVVDGVLSVVDGRSDVVKFNVTEGGATHERPTNSSVATWAKKLKEKTSVS